MNACPVSNAVSWPGWWSKTSACGAVRPPATRTMQDEGLSLQAIANRLNKEGVPTLSGRGQWQAGTVGKLLAQGEEARR